MFGSIQELLVIGEDAATDKGVAWHYPEVVQQLQLVALAAAAAGGAGGGGRGEACCALRCACACMLILCWRLRWPPFPQVMRQAFDSFMCRRSRFHKTKVKAVITLKFVYGKEWSKLGKDPFQLGRGNVPDLAGKNGPGAKNNFIHPVVQLYEWPSKKKLATHHMAEDFQGKWDANYHLQPLDNWVATVVTKLASMPSTSNDDSGVTALCAAATAAGKDDSGGDADEAHEGRGKSAGEMKAEKKKKEKKRTKKKATKKKERDTKGAMSGDL